MSYPDKTESGLPTVLHGFPVHVLLSWAREHTAPNPEVRAALRDSRVLAVLREQALREAPRCEPSCMASAHTCANE